MSDYLQDFKDGKINIDITGATFEDLTTLDEIIDTRYASGHRLYELPNYAEAGACIGYSNKYKKLFLGYDKNIIKYSDFIDKCGGKRFKIDTEEMMEMFK